MHKYTFLSNKKLVAKLKKIGWTFYKSIYKNYERDIFIMNDCQYIHYTYYTIYSTKTICTSIYLLL